MIIAILQKKAYETQILTDDNKIIFDGRSFTVTSLPCDEFADSRKTNVFIASRL